MDISYVFTRKRKEFGKPLAFTDVGPNLILEIDPNPKLKEEFSMVSTVDKEVDNSRKMCAHEVNTITFPTEIRGMNHMEGGWPAAVDNTDEESMARFRKKIEKDKSYVNTVKSLADFLENFVMENNSIDIYEEYFEGETIKRDSDWTLSTLSVYQDLNHSYRNVTDLSWDMASNKFAVVYALRKDSQLPPEACFDSYVWDVENSLKPVYIMKPEVPMTVVEFSYTDPNLILSGYIGGQVALWDIRSKGHAQLSSAMNSHMGRVTGVKWLMSKQDASFFSASCDGTIMSWDIRNLSSSTEKIHLSSEEGENSLNMDQDFAVSCVDYDLTVPNKFMVGTEQAVILAFNRKYEKEDDRLSFRYDNLNGPILAVERNAFYPQLFASCDAWSLKLWSESISDSPMLNMTSQDGYFTDFAWSTIRPSAIYATKTSGVLEIWDIPGKNRRPLTNIKLENEPLLSVAVTQEGHQVICGSMRGSVHLLNISEYLKSTSEIEKELVKMCVQGSDHVEGGFPRSERILEQEIESPSIGIDEEWWDPPEEAEDMVEEHKELFENFLDQNEECYDFPDEEKTLYEEYREYFENFIERRDSY